ncbi:MAG: hypothetical protein ACE5H8_02085 [Alphaproteobacteria bacterium]
MARKPARPGAARRIDWAAIEAAYRAGHAVRDIARRHGVSASTVHRRARRLAWRRETDKGGRVQSSGGAATSPIRKPPKRRAGRGPSHAPTEELARLRALAGKLCERLERAIEGESGNGATLTTSESQAALLLKLCQINEKIVAIERRVAGAEPPTPAELGEHDRDILDRFKRRYGVG